MKILKSAVILLIALAVVSALPVVIFNVAGVKPKNISNDAAVEKLKDASGERFVFFVMGDPESGLFLNEGSTLKLIHNINREGRFKKGDIACVFTTGDNTFRGRPGHYRNYTKLASLLKFPVISASGNHDYDHDGQRFFKELLGKNEFAFCSYNSYFIILDDNEGDLTDAQLKWFEKELKKGSSYAHRFVFMHKAPINPYQQSWYRIEKAAWTKPFMKLCEDYRVDIVFSGHEHMFKENEFNGVKYITTGGGGMLPTIPSWDGGYIHYVSVNVNGDYVSYEVRRIRPPLWLILTYYIWKDLFYIVKSFVI